MSARTASARVALSPRTAERLRGSGVRVAITGASGWMGQASLQALEDAFGEEFVTRVACFGSRAREIRLSSGRNVGVAMLEQLGALPRAPTALLHYAFLTKDRVAGVDTAQYFRLSEEITAAVLAAIPRIGVTHMLFPSSGAVYGQPIRPDLSLREEPETNPYGTQKLRDERHFAQACHENGVRLAVPRVFSLSGAFINKHEAYALASIINAALLGKPVELRARRSVFRSYVSVGDLIEASLAWLFSRTAPEQVVFDTGGEVVEVGELAQRALHLLGRAELAVSRPAPDGSAEDRFTGDGAAFARLAQSQGVALRSLDQQILDTAEYLAALDR